MANQLEEALVLEEALAWLRRGVVPLPIQPHSKRPAVPWKAMQNSFPSPAAVRGMFRTPSLNLGLLTGAVSGNLCVLDFDMPLPYHRWRKRCALETYTVETARGYHVYLRLKSLPPRTLSMEGGEVKISGYVLAPPSIHPGGWQYRALEGTLDIATVETLEDCCIFIDVHKSSLQGQGVEPVHLPVASETHGGLIQAIKESLPINIMLGRYTQLWPTSPDGTWCIARCPLHDDHRPSMWVNIRRGLCRCFREDCKGSMKVMDVIDLYAAIHHLPLRSAILALASELGL